MCCTTKVVNLLSRKSPKTTIFRSVSFMTSHDDVIDKKYKKISKSLGKTFNLMYHTTMVVKLLLLQSPKTTIRYSVVFP